MKTVYVLRTRPSEDQPWSDPEYFRTRKDRNSCATAARILGGYRTHSYEEKKTDQELDEMSDEFVC